MTLARTQATRKEALELDARVDAVIAEEAHRWVMRDALMCECRDKKIWIHTGHPNFAAWVNSKQKFASGLWQAYTIGNRLREAGLTYDQMKLLPEYNAHTLAHLNVAVRADGHLLVAARSDSADAFKRFANAVEALRTGMPREDVRSLPALPVSIYEKLREAMDKVASALNLNSDHKAQVVEALAVFVTDERISEDTIRQVVQGGE